MTIKDHSDIPPVPRLGLRRGAIVFAMFWMTFAGVQHGKPGYNVNSRFALTQAIVDKGTFIVDDYVLRLDTDHWTRDRAIKNGRYYSDKIIGTSLLGVPPYALAKWGAGLLGRGLSLPFARYLTTIFSVSILAAMAATAMMSLLLAFGARLDEAYLLTLAMVFGTMLWGYASLFFSYLPAICFFLFSYNILLRARLSGGLNLRALMAPGLCLGAALLCEYTVGIIVALLSAYVIWHARPRWGVAIFWLFAAIPLSVFAWYSIVCFGEICVPYKYLENPLFRAGMNQGIQGISRFRLPVLFYITFHPYRGLFVLSPFLLLSLAGVGRMLWKERGGGRFFSDGLVCGAVFAGYLAFNSSYYMWWGGSSMGPRHLIPALPFLIPPLLWLLRWGRWAAVLFGVALVASILLVSVPTLVDPQTPAGAYKQETLLNIQFFHAPYIHSLVFTLQWPAFLSARAAWNWATPYALRGPWYLIILSLTWCCGTIAVLRTQKSKEAAAGAGLSSPQSSHP